MNQFLLRYVSTLTLCLFSLIIIGQEKEQYNGLLKIGPYSGNAKYQYVVANGDSIYDGPFLFQRSNLETLLKDQDSSFLIKGNFKDSRANGPWQFQFGEFTSESKSEVVDFEYRILVSGTQEKSSGNFDNGAPDGEWISTIQEIENSEVTKTTFKSHITFEDGVPQKNFQIENDSSALVGRLLRDGMAHDEWTSYGTDILVDIENWFFEEGLLTRIKMETDGMKKEIPVFKSDHFNYRTIPLDHRFLRLLEIQLESYPSTQRRIGQLISDNLYQYEKINFLITQLGSTPFSPIMKVRVPYFALDSLQNKSLKNIVSNYESSSNMALTILSNSHLNIVKRTDKEAAFLYDVAKRLKEEYLNPLETYIELYKDSIVPYLDNEKITQRLWPNGKPQKDILIKLNETERTFELSNKDDFDFSGVNLKTVEYITDYAKTSLTQILERLDPKMSDDLQMQSLQELENDLISLNNLLGQQVDSLSGSLSNPYKTSLKKLIGLADKNLSAYATISNPSEKLTYGESLKTCLNEISSLSTSIASLPEKKMEIENLYTDDIWNPFMATVMEEEVKKRIVESYTEILIPYFIESITDTLNCDQIEPLNNQIIYTNNRMVDLREMDTRKLERKLRRERRPAAVLKLLHQQVTSKNK